MFCQKCSGKLKIEDIIDMESCYEELIIEKAIGYCKKCGQRYQWKKYYELKNEQEIEEI